MKNKLDQILEEVIKINNRIDGINTWRHEHELETKDKEAKMNVELLEYKFLKKYPKLIIIILVVGVSIIILLKLNLF